MQLQNDYFAAYRAFGLTRDGNGVLVAEFHTKGGPLTFTAQDHTEFVDAFYRIAQDRGNKIVILTGAGGEFIPDIEFSSFGNVADPGVWSQVHDEGVQILENIANIRVPVILLPSRDAPIFTLSMRYLRVWSWPPRVRRSTMFHTSPVASCPVTESLRPGVIGPEQRERRRSC